MLNGTLVYIHGVFFCCLSDAELYHVDLIAWINTAASVEPGITILDWL